MLRIGASGFLIGIYIQMLIFLGFSNVITLTHDFESSERS